MNSKKSIVIVALAAVIAYSGSYCVCRCTKFLVRREWLEIHPHSRTHQRWIYAADVGRGSHFDAAFKPKRDPFTLLFYPLWQTELRLRGKYFHHDDIEVIHVDLLESNKASEVTVANAPEPQG